MRRKSRNANGFGFVGVLMIIIALAIVAGAGVYVYHRGHNTKAHTASITTPAKTSTQSSGTATTKGSTTTATYFAIKEWGVRAPYSGTDLTSSPVSGNPNEVWVSSQQLANMDSHCATSSSSGNLGYIGKYLPTDTIPGIPPQPTVQQFLSQDFAASNSAAPAYAKVGSYYYIYWSGEACTTSSLVTQLRSEVGNLVENLQSIPE